MVADIERPPFSKSLDPPLKAENWHALSHEQYFPKHHFFQLSVDVPLSNSWVYNNKDSRSINI